MFNDKTYIFKKEKECLELKLKYNLFGKEIETELKLSMRYLDKVKILLNEKEIIVQNQKEKIDELQIKIENLNETMRAKINDINKYISDSEHPNHRIAKNVLLKYLKIRYIFLFVFFFCPNRLVIIFFNISQT